LQSPIIILIFKITLILIGVKCRPVALMGQGFKRGEKKGEINNKYLKENLNIKNQ
jgi:hypothetical protein